MHGIDLTLGDLSSILKEKAWNRETSSDPDNWSLENKAWGQCAITALLVQELFGGEMLWARVNGTSHYWNSIEGQEYDLTRIQFPKGTEFPEGRERMPCFRTQDYVRLFPETMQRYELLKTRINLLFNV